MKAFYISENIIIRQMSEMDISQICQASGDNSEETVGYFNRQMNQQRNGECVALLAVCKGMIAGYVFLYYRCKWGGLGGKGIPGIVDLFVFPSFRNHGIAGKLLDVAEEIAGAYCDRVYLDVCLAGEYGVAQKLYMKRGYLPDGKGVYYKEQVCLMNALCKNDDELTLCLIKELGKQGAKENNEYSG